MVPDSKLLGKVKSLRFKQKFYKVHLDRQLSSCTQFFSKLSSYDIETGVLTIKMLSSVQNQLSKTFV
jgi:hypothetical protein